MFVVVDGCGERERERGRVKGQWEKGREGMDRAEQGTKRIFNGSWNAKRYYCLLPARQYRVQKGSKRVRKIRKTIAFRGSVSLTGEMKDGVKGKSAAKAKRRRGMGYTELSPHVGRQNCYALNRRRLPIRKSPARVVIKHDR